MTGSEEALLKTWDSYMTALRRMRAEFPSASSRDGGWKFEPPVTFSAYEKDPAKAMDVGTRDSTDMLFDIGHPKMIGENYTVWRNALDVTFSASYPFDVWEKVRRDGKDIWEGRGQAITVTFGHEQWGLDVFIEARGSVPPEIAEYAIQMRGAAQEKLLKVAAACAEKVEKWRAAVSKMAARVSEEPTRRAVARARGKHGS